MADCTVGEIRLFAGTYAPRDWAFCEGQLLPITGNETLYSLIGTTYGGDGRATFGLPDFRGRLPMHFGSGPGLSPRPIGSKFGTETVTLTSEQIPGHNHPMQASLNSPSTPSPQGSIICKDPNTMFYHPSEDPGKLTDFPQSAVSFYGGGEPHNNMMPYTCIQFIIALKGTYPERS